MPGLRSLYGATGTNFEKTLYYVYKGISVIKHPRDLISISLLICKI